MKVTPVKLPFKLTTEDPRRGEGLHVSDIYGSLYQQLEPDRYRSDDAGPPDLKMAIGQAWEQYLERVLVAKGIMCARPGEQVSPEGIKYSPDLLIVNGTDKIGEIKATWLSSKVGPWSKKFGKFLTQGMIYAGWSEIPIVQYWVLHMVGEWNFKTKNGCDPVLNIWDVEFTAQELKQERSLLLNHGKDQGMLDRNFKPVTSWRRT